METSQSFNELKKQASFFFKEKIKTARLALTDVTPLQIMTEEATNGDNESCGPNTQTLRSISMAAFEFEHYLTIVNILHNRLTRFEKRNWRMVYNTLKVLEHLLIHGPDSVFNEFQLDKNVISQMQSFKYIDDKGFNWGLTVKKKSENVLKLLEKGELLKQERLRAREVSREIRGFGSFNHMSETDIVVQESATSKPRNLELEDDKEENTEMNPLLGCNKAQDIAEEDEIHPFMDLESNQILNPKP